MGFLERMRGRVPGEGTPDAAPSPDGATTHASDIASGVGEAGVEPVEEIGVRALTAEEEARLDAARSEYATYGIDPGDLATLATAYDRALDRHESQDASAVIDVLGTAIGDHLVEVGGYRWVVSTDPFGTDLAVEPPRRGVPVVTRMLVAVRWMARDRDWVSGVTEHLARIGRS